MLLRDDRQAALNGVESALLESADGYTVASGRCQDPSLAALFEQAALARSESAAALAPHIRALDDLPLEPDPDRETLGQMIDGIRAYLAADTDAQLVEQRLHADMQLGEAVRAALGEELPEETRRLLEQVLSMLAQTREGLLERGGSA